MKLTQIILLYPLFFSQKRELLPGIVPFDYFSAKHMLT